MRPDIESPIKCAVLDDNLDMAETSADWDSLSPTVQASFFRERIGSPAELVSALRGYGIVVLMRERTAFPPDVISALPDLRLIVTAGHRNGALSVKTAHDRGIAVLGTPTPETPAVEHTWALILGLARSIPDEVRTFRSGGPWQYAIGTDVAGATLGIIGLGRLGARVAAVAQAFGMRVLAWSQNLSDERCLSLGVEQADSLLSLMRQSDFVTIHQVLSERTTGLVGAAEIEAMKPTAYLINTSRAPIVDEPALISALRDRRIAGAGLDVFLNEPLPLEHPYRKLDNVLATPHLGYVTRSAYRIIYEAAVEGIDAWLRGTLIRPLTDEHPAQHIRR